MSIQRRVIGKTVIELERDAVGQAVSMSIDGIKIQTMPLDQLNGATYVVCMNWGGDPPPLDICLKRPCCACGRALRVHPTSPQSVPKICFDCADGTIRPHS